VQQKTNRPPAGNCRQVRVKRRCKRPPPAWQQAGQGKPHPEQTFFLQRLWMNPKKLGLSGLLLGMNLQHLTFCRMK